MQCSGLGGALVFPSTLAAINTTFAEKPDRNRALGIWGGAGAAGLVIGVLLGGVLTRAFGWEAVFFVNVPLAGTALILTFWLIDTDLLAERSAGRSRRPAVLSRSRPRGQAGGRLLQGLWLLARDTRGDIQVSAVISAVLPKLSARDLGAWPP